MRDYPKDINYYILVGGPEHLESFEKHIYSDPSHEWYWTLLKQAKIGDIAFIYLTAPVSRIVGQLEVIGEPFYNVNRFENPKTKNKWMAEVGKDVYFFERRELTMKGLRELFHDWNWLFYPRGNTKIPSHIVEPFLELISDTDAEWIETEPQAA